ncbi:hypothetical protein CYY_004928 [Polysphondylium violaceum]|uniref:Short-chain dehydrogenase/reductase family protein n=1 Tax=Polysphondylium violaceum TaxID=133409 RepID=A0A8J4PVZ8_9MYCE|nr:hypothetical protein CYY_004928 [Polysphondylium violaceum]
MEPINAATSTDKVFFIVGGSSGIGLIVTKAFIQLGYRVASTSRSKENLIKAVGITDTNKFLALENNLLSDQEIKKTIEQVYQHFGRIDVVFCNAGFGTMGTVEEVSDENLRSMFDINFFSAASTLRHVTSFLKSGSHVFLLSSICGLYALPGNSAYNITKFAMDGLGESYAKDVQELGIKVTILNAGSFESTFVSNIKTAARDLKEKYIETYKTVNELIKGLNFKDPNKFADIIVQVVQKEGDAPLHLFIGPDANELANQKIQHLSKELKENEEFTTKRFL